MSEPYEIQYTEAAVADVKGLRTYDQRKVLTGIETHLRFQPRQESKSRIKALAQPSWSQDRLRVEDLRAYYDVSEDTRAVSVLRVLQKTTGATPENPT